MDTEALKQKLGNAEPHLTLSCLVHFIKGTVMCLVSKCVEIQKKKKYSNLIREKNMIIFIDRGTTRSNYPKLCLSDNAVSFSSLMSTAELMMQGQEIPMWLKDRGIGHHISYAKGKKNSVKEWWILKIFVIEMIIGSTWLDLLSTGDPSRNSLSDTCLLLPF